MPDRYAPVITSTANPRVKALLALRQRAGRDAAGRIPIEGRRELRMAMEAGHRLFELFDCPELAGDADGRALAGQAAAAGVPVVTCSAAVMRRVSYRERPDGLVAVGAPLGCALAALHVGRPALLIVAEAVEKPGNLGAILRSADAAGAQAVIVTDPRTDVSNPNVVRASLGTAFTVPVAVTTTPEARAWLAAQRVRTIAATPGAGRLYTAADLRGDVAVVVGSEQDGLSAAWRGTADEEVRIPMLGRADSLNVSAATTILLYEAVRQRAAAG